MLSRKKILKIRSDIVDAIRLFFKKRGYLEVQTPQLVRELAPEPYIEAFEIQQSKRHQKTPYFLITSPELMMKRLIAEGFERIFQICKVFRKEESGERHLQEFTMLEWYCAHADYRTLMQECESLLLFCAEAAGSKTTAITYNGTQIDILPPFKQITVRDAYINYAGWDPFERFDENRFDEDMTMIEKRLPASRPCFLMDYPTQRAALARLKPDDQKVAERVELYAGGLELANGFSELNDSDEQIKRFEEDMRLRKLMRMADYPFPQHFLADMKRLPTCAGMALGIDRLVMLLANATDIRQTVTFAE